MTSETKLPEGSLLFRYLTLEARRVVFGLDQESRFEYEALKEAFDSVIPLERLSKSPILKAIRDRVGCSDAVRYADVFSEDSIEWSKREQIFLGLVGDCDRELHEMNYRNHLVSLLSDTMIDQAQGIQVEDAEMRLERLSSFGDSLLYRFLTLEARKTVRGLDRESQLVYDELANAFADVIPFDRIRESPALSAIRRRLHDTDSTTVVSLMHAQRRFEREYGKGHQKGGSKSECEKIHLDIRADRNPTLHEKNYLEVLLSFVTDDMIKKAETFRVEDLGTRLWDRAKEEEVRFRKEYPEFYRFLEDEEALTWAKAWLEERDWTFPENPKPTDYLSEAFGFDSLDLMELSVEIEDEFGIDTTDENLDFSLGGLVKLLAKKSGL